MSSTKDPIFQELVDCFAEELSLGISGIKVGVSATAKYNDTESGVAIDQWNQEAMLLEEDEISSDLFSIKENYIKPHAVNLANKICMRAADKAGIWAIVPDGEYTSTKGALPVSLSAKPHTQPKTVIVRIDAVYGFIS